MLGPLQNGLHLFTPPGLSPWPRAFPGPEILACRTISLSFTSRKSRRSARPLRFSARNRSSRNDQALFPGRGRGDSCNPGSRLTSSRVNRIFRQPCGFDNLCLYPDEIPTPRSAQASSFRSPRRAPAPPDRHFPDIQAPRDRPRSGAIWGSFLPHLLILSQARKGRTVSFRAESSWGKVISLRRGCIESSGRHRVLEGALITRFQGYTEGLLSGLPYQFTGPSPSGLHLRVRISGSETKITVLPCRHRGKLKESTGRTAPPPLTVSLHQPSMSSGLKACSSLAEWEYFDITDTCFARKFSRSATRPVTYPTGWYPITFPSSSWIGSDPVIMAERLAELLADQEELPPPPEGWFFPFSSSLTRLPFYRAPIPFRLLILHHRRTEESWKSLWSP